VLEKGCEGMNKNTTGWIAITLSPLFMYAIAHFSAVFSSEWITAVGACFLMGWIALGVELATAPD
jgi:hypothetical protein